MQPLLFLVVLVVLAPGAAFFGSLPLVAGGVCAVARNPTPFFAVRDLEGVMDGVEAKFLETIDEEERIGRYAFTIEIPGEITAATHSSIEKELRSKANFPGFRKGQIPPYAMSQVKLFCVEECVNDGIVQVLEAYGLAKLEGEAGHAEVKEDTADLQKAFKPGKPFAFSCELNAKAGAEEPTAATEGYSDSLAAGASVVDVQMVEPSPAVAETSA